MDALKAALKTNATSQDGKTMKGGSTGADLIKRAMQEELKRKLAAKKLKAKQQSMNLDEQGDGDFTVVKSIAQ